MYVDAQNKIMKYKSTLFLTLHPLTVTSFSCKEELQESGPHSGNSQTQISGKYDYYCEMYYLGTKKVQYVHCELLMLRIITYQCTRI